MTLNLFVAFFVIHETPAEHCDLKQVVHIEKDILKDEDSVEEDEIFNDENCFKASSSGEPSRQLIVSK